MDRRRKLKILGAFGGGVAAAPLWATEFTGTGYINCGSDADIDNLTPITVEGYWLITPVASTSGFFGKGGNADMLNLRTSDIRTTGVITCATTAAKAEKNVSMRDSAWHHVAFTYDNDGTRKIKVFFDGVALSPLDIDAAGVGDRTSDAAQTLCLGSVHPSVYLMSGKIGWVRVSNNLRYTANFTPIPRSTPPETDANTVRLFKMNDGTGTVITDSSANAKHGSMTNGSWVESP